jgi:histidinol-phosphate aminotransferase
MVFLASGADEAISLLTLGFLNPEEAVIVPQPTFCQYAAAATLAGGMPAAVAVLPDLTTDFIGMLAAITSATKVIFVCNPNNPTGIVEGEARLRSFLSQVPSHILVVLDEAYAEYVSRPDFVSGISLLTEFSNILVIRTFSKLYRLAGLRLGYGIANEKIVSVIERVRNPFNVNSLALAAAEAALDDREFRQQVVRKNRQQRERLTREFATLGFTVYPSETNFLFVDTHTDSEKLCKALIAEGIIIRSGLGWGRPSFARISIGSQEQNDRLLACLQRIL